MQASSARLFRDDARKCTKLEMQDGTVFLWEPIRGSFLETCFDSDGAVIDQLRIDHPVKERIAYVLSSSNAEAAEASGFSEIVLKRGCPKCGAEPLRRCLDGHASGSVPIIPLHSCSACGSRCYMLTDKYLARLVERNRQLFNEQESKSIDADNGAFMSELRENIIRIFASKKLLCIL